MLLELFGLYGIIIVVLFFFVEFSKKTELGIIPSVLLLIVGVWLVASGLQMHTGEITTATETQVQSGTNLGSLNGNSSYTEITSGNITMDGTKAYQENNTVNLNSTITLTRNETNVLVYGNVPSLPYMDTGNVLGIVCILVGIYAGGYYMSEYYRTRKAFKS